MDITTSQLQFGLSLVMALGALAAAGVLWRLKGEFASKGDIKSLVSRIEQLERDQVGLAARVDQVPTHADLAAVRAAISDVSGDVKALDATIETDMRGIRDQLALLMAHHMERT